ncbi:MAG: response regulator [Nitrospirae bacterium]|nr:response regulator [Nitrospirota bacterium]
MNKFKVLIADSTPSLRQFIKYALEDHFPGIVIEMANTGKNIQQRLEGSRYDLILYEKEMPLLDGDDLLEWLRSHETLKAAPFIMMSANSDEESLKKAIQLGADAYLLKPFKIDVLINKVTAVVNKLNRRKSHRYTAEGGVVLKFNSRLCKGSIIDISPEGLSGRFLSKENIPHILEKVDAGIELKNKSWIEGLEGVIIRIEAVEAPDGAGQIQLAIRFMDTLAPEKKKQLADVLSSL